MPTDQEATLTFFQSSIDRTDKSVVTKEKAVEERYDRSGHLVIRGLPEYYRCHGGLRTTVFFMIDKHPQPPTPGWNFFKCIEPRLMAPVTEEAVEKLGQQLLTSAANSSTEGWRLLGGPPGSQQGGVHHPPYQKVTDGSVRLMENLLASKDCVSANGSRNRSRSADNWVQINHIAWG